MPFMETFVSSTKFQLLVSNMGTCATNTLIYLNFIVEVLWRFDLDRVVGAGKVCRERHSPALTVMASMNCSLQLFVPTTSARLVFLISLSTVL